MTKHCKRVAPLLLLISIGCSRHSPPSTKAWDEGVTDDRRARLVADMQYFLHQREFRVGAKRFPRDCSGLVMAALYRNGMDVYSAARESGLRGSGVRLLYSFTERYGTIFQDRLPERGDLLFFSNTYDRNRDGRLNDELTHIGIVEDVDEDGTITFINRVNHGNRRMKMNLFHPYIHKSKEGKVLNSFLRRRKRSDPKGTSYTAGALLKSYGSLIPDAQMDS